MHEHNPKQPREPSAEQTRPLLKEWNEAVWLAHERYWEEPNSSVQSCADWEQVYPYFKFLYIF